MESVCNSVCLGTDKFEKIFADFISRKEIMKQVSRPLKWLSTAKMVNLAPVSGNSTKMRIEIAQKNWPGVTPQQKN